MTDGSATRASHSRWRRGDSNPLTPTCKAGCTAQPASVNAQVSASRENGTDAKWRFVPQMCRIHFRLSTSAPRAHYTNNPSSNQHPNQHDYDQLVTIYTLLDSTTRVGPARSRAQVGNHKSSWGARLEGSRASGQTTYVRDFGSGTKVITFVSWA